VKPEIADRGTVETAGLHSTNSGYPASRVFHVFRHLILAWQFLTAIPLGRTTHDAKPEELAASMSWYPLVGSVLGALLFTADLFLARIFPTQVTSLLLLLILVGITRGLHQDGLADTIDGLAGGRTAQARLAIMRDGSIGAIGATGLFLALGLRYAGLNALPAGEHLALLIGMPIVGRWAMVIGAFHSTYARSEGGLAQPFLAHVSWRHLCVATFTAGLALMLLLGPWPAFCCLFIGAGLVRLAVVWFHRMFGGVTGDLLGATNEVIEILFIVIVPVVFFR